MQLYEFKETQERVILIGVQTGVGDDVEASLDELDEQRGGSSRYLYR